MPTSSRRALLAGTAAALPVTAAGATPVASVADATLVRLAGEYRALEYRWRALTIPEDEAKGAEKVRLRAEMETISDRQEEILEAALAIRPDTVRGLAALATILAAWPSLDLDPPLDPEGKFEAHILGNLLQIGGMA